MLFLWNPCNEPLPFQYSGLSYTLEAGKRMKVDEAMGNHVLNSMGSRGMTRLVFDDEGKSINEEQIAADAIERNKDFKIRQVYVYNERNERRKAAGQAYDPPTKQVKDYAAALGIQLLKPYDMQDAEKGQIGQLTKENQDLRDTLATVLKQQEAIMAKLTLSEVEKNPEEDKKVRCKICNQWMLKSELEGHILEKHKGG
jgi:hypothetical protein